MLAPLQRFLSRFCISKVNGFFAFCVILFYLIPVQSDSRTTPLWAQVAHLSSIRLLLPLDSHKGVIKGLLQKEIYQQLAGVKIMQRMGSWGKNKSHSRKMTLLESEPGKATEGERERGNGHVFETQCCVTESSPCCQWQQVKRAALLQLVYPADLAGWGESICACLSLCYRERGAGGDMLCSLHLSGGQESRVLPVAHFYPVGACVQRYGPICVCVRFDAYLTHMHGCSHHCRFWILSGLFH